MKTKTDHYISTLFESTFIYLETKAQTRKISKEIIYRITYGNNQQGFTTELPA